MNKYLSYFLTFSLIAEAGFPFFTGDFWLLAFTGIAILEYISKGFRPDVFIIKYLMAFVLIMILQSLLTKSFMSGPFFGWLLRIVYAYFVLKIVGYTFINKYIVILKQITIVSLILYFILAYVPGMYEFFRNISVTYIHPLETYEVNVRTNLIIYTNDYWLLDMPPRNAGPFWEPGAFGMFLIVAIVFNTLIKSRFLLKDNWVFLVGIFTTFSMGTFFSILVFIYSFLLLIRKLNPVTLSIAVMLLLLSYWAFNKYDFLGEKFEKRYLKTLNFDTKQSYQDLDYQVGRNEKAILDLNAFINNPIIGEGQFISYEFGNSPSGLTSILRKWGIIGFLLLFYTMYKSFRRYIYYRSIKTNYIWVALFSMMSIALTQNLYGKALFIGFCFMFLILSQQEMLKVKKYVRENAKIII